MKLRLLLLLLTPLLLLRCDSQKDEKEAIEELNASDNWKQDYAQYLEQALDEIQQLQCSSKVIDYYRTQKFPIHWVFKDSLTNEGKAMLKLVQRAFIFGLMPESYSVSKIDSLSGNLNAGLLNAAHVELLLTDALFSMAVHISEGQYHPETFAYHVPADSVSFDFTELMELALKESPAAALGFVEPDNYHYKALARGCEYFCNTFSLTDTTFNLSNYKSDSLGTYALARKALVAFGFADTSILNSDSLFKLKLKDFQMFHGMGNDGKIGYNTSKAFGMSNLERWRQIAINMERWRWRNKMPETHIFVNIPEFALYYFRNDSLIRKHRVVVGAATTQTPEFEAKLTYLNVYPYWSVPHSISSKEILPYVKQNPQYLANNGYNILSPDGKEVLDPSTIDFSQYHANYFPFRFRQNYGYGNALGVIAFMFPNKHDVFIHDTPSKFFFTTGTRAYSHGCIRLQDPVDLAKEILKADGNEIEPDTLQMLLDKHVPQMVYLKKKIPIFIEYHTAGADTDSTLVLPIDVYGRDTLYRELFPYKIIKRS